MQPRQDGGRDSLTLGAGKSVRGASSIRLALSVRGDFFRVLRVQYHVCAAPLLDLFPFWRCHGSAAARLRMRGLRQ